MSLRTTPVQADNPRIVMITAPNPGPKTLDGTQTYLVGREQAYVIDPGPADSGHLAELAAWVRENAIGVTAILLTHGHPDHAPGAVALGSALDVPIHAAANLDTSYFPYVPTFVPIAPGAEFQTDGEALVAVSAPGHSKDHLVFWLPGSRILFSGDVILGRGTTLVAPPEGNMIEYMATLERLAALHPRLIAPGHGPMVTDAAGRIQEYIIHRRLRESQILRALSVGEQPRDGLVNLIYGELEPALRPLAEGSVAAQLEKLVHEGRIEQHGAAYRLAASPSTQEETTASS